MPVHLMGPNPLHLDLLQGTLITAGSSAADIHVATSREALERALQTTPQATLIIDLGSEADASVLQWLGQLTRHWRGLQVVVLANQRSPALLLQAMRSGVREVLDSPPEPQDLLQALQHLNDTAHLGQTDSPSSPAPSKGHVLAFVSSKGGCGNTLLASNLAWLLATEFRRNSALVDLDLIYGDASFYVGGGSARHSVTDLMREDARLDGQLVRSSMHPVHERLHLLAAPALPGVGAAPTQALPRLLELLRLQQQVVVIDIPHHVDELGMQALRQADQVFVLLRNRVPDVRNAQRLLRLLREQGIARERLRPVLNCHNEEGGLDRTTIDKALDPGSAYLIADDPVALQGCEHLGLPLHEHDPGSPVLRDLRRLASASLSLPLPRRRGWLSRWMSAPR